MVEDRFSSKKGEKRPLPFQLSVDIPLRISRRPDRPRASFVDQGLAACAFS
jgi:hypothetical protein